MPTEKRSSKAAAAFQREDHYIVIKRSDLKKVPVAYRSHLVNPMFSLLGHLPRRECVVVESDWPEYPLVWAMIEHRMAGKPVPDFNLWRQAEARAAQRDKGSAREAELQAELDKVSVASKRLAKVDDQIITELGKRLAEAEKRQPLFVATVLRKLRRFEECASDNQGADIGSHWFEVLTRLGLLNRVQRSPALWELTDEGEQFLASPGCADGEKIECGDCPGCTGPCRHREETP